MRSTQTKRPGCGRRPSLATTAFTLGALALILAAPKRASCQEKILHSFIGSDGGIPMSLVRDRSGRLFGTTGYGGAFSNCPYDYVGCGTIFELTPSSNGSWTLTTLYSFNGSKGGGLPRGNLIIDGKGNLYGTTEYGGDRTCSDPLGRPGCGTVYKLSPQPGGSWKYTVLYTFQGNPNDGALPFGGIISDGGGNLYGTTYAGGPADLGTVFKLTRSNQGWTEDILHTFSGPDGSYPVAGLALDSQGNLYGSAQYGGDFGFGTVFKIDPSSTETTLHSYLGGSDGFDPVIGFAIDAADNLYGAVNGGDFGAGKIFQMDTAGNQTALFSFGATTGDGSGPADLIIDSAGNIYGTTTLGGNAGVGTVYMLDPARNETMIYNFTGLGSDEYPGALVRDGAGNLYGTTTGDDIDGYSGEVFKIKPN